MTKLCCDCEHYMPGVGHPSNELQAKYSKCARTKRVSVVYPLLIPPEYDYCEVERDYKWSGTGRQRCGPDGNYFEWRDENNVTEDQDSAEDAELHAGGMLLRRQAE